MLELDVLPPIPDKRYFTIGEVAELCSVKPHVLRYWEQEFSQLKPSKRRGNRRYYQRGDVVMIREIKSLLYEQGYTIGGARQQLAQNKHIIVNKQPKIIEKNSEKQKSKFSYRELISELKEILNELP